MVSGVRCNTAQIGFSTLKGSYGCSAKSRIPILRPRRGRRWHCYGSFSKNLQPLWGWYRGWAEFLYFSFHFCLIKSGAKIKAVKKSWQDGVRYAKKFKGRTRVCGFLMVWCFRRCVIPALLTLRLQIFFNAPLSGLVTMIFSMPEKIAIARRNL